MLICAVGPFSMFSKIKRVIHWPDSEPLGLMYYCEFHDTRKSKFLLRILF